MINDAELLIELASIDEIEAYVPTAKDQEAGMVPEWCELVLHMKRSDEWPISASLPLRRHDGELILSVLHDVLHPRSASSAGTLIWRDLDKAVRRIQKRVERGRSPKIADVAEARALATALAYLNNPMQPDVDQVRDQAMERYEQRN